MNKRVWILASGLCLMVSVAMADNYVVKNGQGSLITFAAKSVGSVLHPLSIMEGLIGGAGAPAAVNVDSGGNVQVNNTSMVNNLSSIASSNTAIAASAATIATNTGNTNPVPVFATGNSYSHISTATTTLVKTGAGILHTICINTLGGTASTVEFDAALTHTTPVMGILNSMTTGQACYTYDVAFSTGLSITTTGSGAPDVTVSYR